MTVPAVSQGREQRRETGRWSIYPLRRDCPGCEPGTRAAARDGPRRLGAGMQARQSAALAASRIAARGFESLLQIAKSAVSRSREVGDSLIMNPRLRIEIRSPIAKSGIRCRVAGRIGCGIAAHAPDALRRYSRPCINSCCTCARRTQAILTSVH